MSDDRSYEIELRTAVGKALLTVPGGNLLHVAQKRAKAHASEWPDARVAMITLVERGRRTPVYALSLRE